MATRSPTPVFGAVRAVALVLAWVLVAGLVPGCGADGGPPPADPLQPAVAPQRIVAANSAALDLLLALVDRTRIAGIPEPAFVYASETGGAGAWDRARTFAVYRGEDVLALRPDLVVTHRWQNADTTSVLRDHGVPVLALPALRTFDDLLTIVDQVAAAVDEPERGAALAGALAARRDALAADHSRANVRVMSYVNFGTGGWTAGTDTSLDLIISLAGMRNAAAEAGFTDNARIDIEHLLRIDPDVLVVDGTAEDPGTSARYLLDTPALAGLSALRAGRLVYLPPNLQSTVSHRVVEAAERLAAEVDALGLP